MTKCSYDPKVLKGKPIGMFHCPECGEMVLAGIEHLDYNILEEMEKVSEVYLQGLENCMEERGRLTDVDGFALINEIRKLRRILAYEV